MKTASDRIGHSFEGTSRNPGGRRRARPYGRGMTTPRVAEDARHSARYTFRLRVSSAAHASLLGEWDRIRWIWNECVAKSKQVHAWNRTRPEGTDKHTCGPAQLDKMLTEARQANAWLRDGASVPQQQLIRDFGRSRAKAQKDIKDRLPMARRAGMPKYKKVARQRRPRRPCGGEFPAEVPREDHHGQEGS